MAAEPSVKSMQSCPAPRSRTSQCRSNCAPAIRGGTYGTARFPATIVAVGHDLVLLSRTRPSRAATECLGTMATLYDTVPSSPGSLSVPGATIISNTLSWTFP